MAPRTGRQSRVYVVAANSRVFSRVLIIDRSTSEKLALLHISFSLFLILVPFPSPSRFILLSPVKFKSLSYLADGDDRVTDNSLGPGAVMRRMCH